MAKARRGRKPKTEAKSEPLAEVPEPPSDLGAYAANYWRSLAPQLVELGILTPLHTETFRVLCETWQEYRTLSQWLEADPSRMTFITASGYEQETPQLRQRDKAAATLQKLWSKFGLTPNALAQLGKHGGVKARTASAISKFAQKKYENDQGNA
ncbi:phage terminase small subunit P27 family [Aureliella helgolandensis]|uniref:Phage terminase, small subunit n=1 Tax=Aureliella helgolandensis TaxID=2527968 RepID=A0A518GDU5_9BACT|nr:phage terminase small subunit P27 family [Aureliella helgolandensis]QDV26728.1 Phage terminase, small subunit [Aureliella helgolandensis]